MAPRRNKSGLLPQLYLNLREDEKAPVKAAMKAYNAIYPDQPYFDIGQYYQDIYRRGQQQTQPKKPTNTKALKLAAVLGIAGALAVAGGSILWGNLFFAASNPPLIAQFWSNGGRAQVCQFAVFEGLTVLGVVLHLGGIT